MIENETLEFKKSLAELGEGIISLCAMLNKHHFAELWFGIDPSGKATGLTLGEKTLRDVSQAIAEQLEPKVFPKITTETVDGKPCLKIICTGTDTPYFAKGRAYIRVADSDRKLSSQELEHLILKKHHEALRWDQRVCPHALTEMDENKVKRFLKLAGLEWDSLENALTKLDCLRDKKPSNAAMLFFGKEPAARLRCAVFAGITPATILDQHDYAGDILYLIEEAQNYILKNIRIGMRLEGLYRVDVPEIALAALREAIINAFCHRDYRDPEEIRVAIFKDRVEIRNPGRLFGNLKLSDLRIENIISQRRNPLIAELLRRIKMVEAWGRGIPLILENEPKVEFKEMGEIFIALFKRRKNFPEADFNHSNEKTTIKTTTKNNANIANNSSLSALSENDSNKKTTTKTTTKTNAILQLILDNPNISLDEIATHLGLTKDGVRYHTDKLQQNGILSREGKKGGRWMIHSRPSTKIKKP